MGLSGRDDDDDGLDHPDLMTDAKSDFHKSVFSHNEFLSKEIKISLGEYSWNIANSRPF